MSTLINNFGFNGEFKLNADLTNCCSWCNTLIMFNPELLNLRQLLLFI